MQGKMAIVGNGDSILAFKAGGVDAYRAETATKAKELLRKLAKNYAVIFLTDALAAELDEFLNRFRESAYPIIVPIGEGGASLYAETKLKNAMKSALGIDILFDREGK